MGYFKAQELATYMQADPYNINRVNTSAGDASLPAWEGDVTTVPVEWCQEFIDRLHGSVIKGHFTEWKSLRPWEVVDLTANLDPTKPWIGWECETGWESREDRGSVLTEFFSRFNHVCTDNEGPEYGVEMTFSPDDGSVYTQQHPLHFICEMGAAHGACRHDAEDEVGTHINISTPSYRAMLGDADRWEKSPQNIVASVLNRALRECSSDWEELFGRGRLYGGFFVQGDVENDGGWLEGKLFNTTYSKYEADRYMERAEYIATMVEATSRYVIDNLITSHIVMITNPLAAFRGATPEFAECVKYYADGDMYIEHYDEDDEHGWGVEDDDDEEYI